MDKLLPCPFCGSNDVLIDCVGTHWVECNQCESSGPKSDSEEDAITAWNTRHTPEGWRLVPDEATRAQESDAEDYWQSRRFAAFSDDPRTWAGVYQAMLAAAPKWGGE